jgi:hypothetical protein
MFTKPSEITGICEYFAAVVALVALTVSALTRLPAFGTQL